MTTSNQIDDLVALLDDDKHQFEYRFGDMWFQFERITSIFVNNNCEVMFLLRLPPLNNQVIQVSCQQISHHAATQRWINQFKMWSREHDVAICKLYTWQEINRTSQLSDNLLEWLRVNKISTLSDTFQENGCYHLNSIPFLTEDVLQSWNLNNAQRRYILKVVQEFISL